MPVVLTAWFIWQPLMTCVLHSSWSCASFLNSSKLINPRHHQTISSLEVRCVWLSIHTSISLLYNAELNHQHVYAPRKHKSFPSTCCLPSITTFLWPLYLSSCLSVTSHTHTHLIIFISLLSYTVSFSRTRKIFHGHHGLRRVPKVSLVRPLATGGTGGITNPTAKQWRKTTGDKSWQEQTKNWNCIYLSASTCRFQ